MKNVSSVSQALELENPLSLFNSTKDFFGEDLEDNDSVLNSIRELCPKDYLSSNISVCLRRTLDALQRQYEHYFKLDITEQLTEETQSARLHNIDAEEVMGMFSAALHHSPNARVTFSSSKIR